MSFRKETFLLDFVLSLCESNLNFSTYILLSLTKICRNCENNIYEITNFTSTCQTYHFVQVKKGKVLTKGAKQIMEDNTSTLKFYAIMAISAMVAHVGVTFVMFEFTTLTIVSFVS